MNGRFNIWILFVLMIAGCKDNPTIPPATVTKSYKVPADQYIFLERWVVVDGVTIKGEYCSSNIDFPTYSFDSDKEFSRERSTFQSLILSLLSTGMDLSRPAMLAEVPLLV